MRIKNQILKYHIWSPIEIMRKIQDQRIKNILNQWETEKENRKIYKI